MFILYYLFFNHQIFFNMKERKVTIAIVYHSAYGHTEKLAHAIAEGIQSIDAAESLLLNVSEACERWDDLEQSDAIIFGSPTYMGGVSAQFKAFADATSPNVLNKNNGWRNKIAAGFTNSCSRSGDKLAVLQYLSIFAAQHSMHWVNLGLPVGHNASFTSEDSLNRHGFFLGLGAQSDYDSPPDIAPPSCDIQTAHHLGQRVATVTQHYLYGQNN